MSLSRSLAVMMFLSIPGVAGERHAFEAPGPKILSALDVRPAECGDAGEDRWPDHVASACGTTGHSFKSLKKAWRQALRGPLGDVLRWDGAPWRDTGANEKTMYANASVPVAVVFDFDAGRAVVRWPRSYPGCHRGFEFTWFPDSTDILPPVAKQPVRPEFPEPARVERTGGTVLGSFLVDESGRVVDVCVVAALPLHRGFEQATVEAYEEATYEPASRAGTPVAIASPVSVEFELMGDGSGSGASVLARAWFENALAARQTPEEK